MPLKTAISWIRQKTPHDNINAICKTLLQIHEVPVSHATVDYFFATHPGTPSILSLKDAFQEFGLTVKAMRVAPENLNDLPLPGVAFLDQGDPKFVLLNNINEGKIRYLDTEQGWMETQLNKFLDQWSGIWMSVAKTEGAGEIDFEKNKAKESNGKLRKPILYILGTILLLALFLPALVNNGDHYWSALGLLAVKIVGIGVSVLLLIAQENKHNPLIEKICGGAKGGGCGSVLNSAAAQPFSWLSLSELGGLYFIGGFISLFLSFVSGNPAFELKFLTLLTLLALPFTFYSVFYQGVIMKTWCRLCLMVQGLFWMEFLVLLPSLEAELAIPEWQDLAILTTGFLLPAFLYVTFKPSFIPNAKGLQERISLLLNEYGVFESFRAKQPHVEMEDFEIELELGNPAGPLSMVMITKPDCKHCAKAHLTIHSLLHQFPGKFSLKIRFKTSTSPDSQSRQVALQILHLLKNEGQEAASLALHEWYSVKDLSKPEPWLSGFESKPGTESEELLDQHIAWAKAASGDRGTPLFFIEGQPLHPYYSIHSARRHLPRLMR